MNNLEKNRDGLKSKLVDAWPDHECSGIDDIAAKFGLGIQRARQVVTIALKKRLVQNLTKVKGRKILYAPPMVDGLVEAYNAGQIVGVPKPRAAATTKKLTTTRLNNAVLVLQVPIFDPEIAKLLKAKYGDDGSIAKFVADKLVEEFKPAMAKLADLIAEFSRREAEIMKSV